MTIGISLIEVFEVITQRKKWFCAENIIQVLHLIGVYVYLMLVFLKCGPSLDVDMDAHVIEIMHVIAALVVCVAWLDLSYSMQYIMFGRWSSMGLYMSMLVDVSQLNKEYQLKSLLRLPRR